MLFIGHVGVLLTADDGTLYFVEKVAFQEPYRLLHFADRTELSDYLMGKYDVSWGQNTAQPFIMENGELMRDGVQIRTRQHQQIINASYNIVTVEGAAASRVFFHLKAEAVRMGE